MIAVLPGNERECLEALNLYVELNGIPESSFNRLTLLAAHLFSAPIAMVALLESERLVIKSSYGLNIIEAPREDGFCAHAILSDDVMIVGDATRDRRFSDLSGVLGKPYTRFYAGALLETRNGFRLGTLCVVDTIPRTEIDPTQIVDLKDLASEVMELLELHRAKLEINEMQERLSTQSRALAESRELWRRTEQRATLALDAGRMGYWERDAETDLITLSPNLSIILGLEPGDHQCSMDEWLQSVDAGDRAMVTQLSKKQDERKRTMRSSTVPKARTVASAGLRPQVLTVLMRRATSVARRGSPGTAQNLKRPQANFG